MQLLLFVLILLVTAACSPPPEPPKAAAAEPVAEAAFRPDLILEPGENPLWFEFSAGGLQQIDSPSGAALLPFTPWPLARHVSGMLEKGEELILTLNREGFIIVYPAADTAAETLAVWRCVDPDFWGRYTIASSFIFEEKPAVLLYRDDFFSDAAAAPSPRVWTIDAAGRRPTALSVPALESFPAEWDIDSLNRSAGGFWYYRAVLKAGTRPDIRYYRSGDLATAGEESSLGDFQNSLKPEAAVPEPLRQLVQASGGASFLVAASPVPRRFTVAETDSKNDASGGPLPPLPEGFVYTAAGICGNTLLAAWEEQEDFSIGSAGLMIKLYVDKLN